MLAGIGRVIGQGLNRRTGFSRLRLAFAVDDQSLADCRDHCFGLERLGDQIGRLGPFAGQQPLGEGGDEDHRHAHRAQDIFHRVDPARSVGQADIGKDEFGAGAFGQRDRLGAGPGDTGHAMAQLFDDRADMQRDDCFVFDDHHCGLEAVGNRLPGSGDIG